MTTEEDQAIIQYRRFLIKLFLERERRYSKEHIVKIIANAPLPKLLEASERLITRLFLKYRK